MSRRDDLISLAYILAYLASGKIAFVKHEIQLMDQIKVIKRKKNKYTALEFCKSQKCMFLQEFLKRIYDLKFEEEPDYAGLKWLLEKNILDTNMAP